MADCQPKEVPLISLGAGAETAERVEADRDLRRDVERMFVENRDQVYFYLLASGARPSDADDLTQETFVRMYIHLRTGTTISATRPWLFRVAHNLLVDGIKRGYRQVTPSESAWITIEETVADPRLDPEDAVLKRERSARLRRAFNQLTPLQTQYMLLRAEGLRYRQIAEIYGVAISTVTDVVRRAIERLGKDIE